MLTSICLLVPLKREEDVWNSFATATDYGEFNGIVEDLSSILYGINHDYQSSSNPYFISSTERSFPTPASSPSSPSTKIFPSPITTLTPSLAESNHNTSFPSSTHPSPASASRSYTSDIHTAVSSPNTGPCQAQSSGTIVCRSVRSVLLRVWRSASRCRCCCE